MPPKSEIVQDALERDGGYLIVPDAPGIGIELLPDAAERHPTSPAPSSRACTKTAR